MKTTARRYRIALLLALLALAGFTIYAQRVVTTARSENPNITREQAIAAAFTGNKPAPATINARRSNSHAPASTNLKEPDESATTMEPAQMGGSYDLSQSVIAGGGDRSSGARRSPLIRRLCPTASLGRCTAKP